MFFHKLIMWCYSSSYANVTLLMVLHWCWRYTDVDVTLMFFLKWCWCCNAADITLLAMLQWCWCDIADDITLMMMLHGGWCCTDVDVALLMMLHWCWCYPVWTDKRGVCWQGTAVGGPEDKVQLTAGQSTPADNEVGSFESLGKAHQQIMG